MRECDRDSKAERERGGMATRLNIYLSITSLIPCDYRRIKVMMILYLPLGSARCVCVCAYLLCRRCSNIIIKDSAQKKPHTRFPSKYDESTEESSSSSIIPSTQTRVKSKKPYFFCLILFHLLRRSCFHRFRLHLTRYIIITGYMCCVRIRIHIYNQFPMFLSAPKVIFISNTFLFFHIKNKQKKHREYPLHTLSWLCIALGAPYSRRLECFVCICVL